MNVVVATFNQEKALAGAFSDCTTSPINRLQHFSPCCGPGRCWAAGPAPPGQSQLGIVSCQPITVHLGQGAADDGAVVLGGLLHHDVRDTGSRAHCAAADHYCDTLTCSAPVLPWSCPVLPNQVTCQVPILPLAKLPRVRTQALTIYLMRCEPSQ